MMSGLAARAANGAMVTLVGAWLRFLLQLASTMVLARLLLPSDFGVVAMVTAISGLAILLSDFGLSMASLQSQEISTQQKTNLFWMNTAAGALAAVAVYLSGDLLGYFYGIPAAVQVVHAIAPIYLVHAGVAMLRAELSRELRFKLIAVIEVGAQLFSLMGGIATGVMLHNYWALIVQQILSPVLLFAGFLALSQWKPGIPRRTEGMFGLFRFGVNTGGVQVLNYVSSNVDSVVLGRVWGPNIVGEYDQAYQLFRVPLQQLAAPMTRVAVPVLSRLDEPHRFQNYVERAQLILVYVIGGAFLTAAAVSEPLMYVVLGPQWVEAPGIFRILALGGLFQAFGYVYYWVFIARNLTGIQLRISVISRMLMILFILVGVYFSAVGVALGAVAGLIVNWVLLSIFGVRRAGLDLRPLLLTSLRPLLLFGIASSITFVLSSFIFEPVMPPALNLCVSLLTQTAFVFAAMVVPAYRQDTKLIVEAIAKARRGK